MNTNLGRGIERRSLLYVTIVLCLAFFTLHKNYQKKFEHINASYENKTTVNLDKGFHSQQLANLLVEGNYIPDETSAIFISNFIKTKLTEGVTLPNLGELNKKNFRISVTQIDSCGSSSLKNRADKAREQLGITVALPTNDKIATDTTFNHGSCEMKVKVQEFDSKANFLVKKLNKNLKVVPDVLVQITEHNYDSLAKANRIILGYAKTDKNGIATFKGLKSDGYYSVLPIQRGFEYGNPKGTVNGNLGSIKVKDRVFTFTQREHKISPFDALSNLKIDNVLTVRTPQEYLSKLVTNLVFILLAWWALHIYLCIRKKRNDQLILPLLMTLTGICLLTMYSIINPLTDKMLGNDMAIGILVGIFLIGVFSEINFVSFFNNHLAIPFDFTLVFWRWLLKPYKAKLQFIWKLAEKNRIYKSLLFVFIPLCFCLLLFDFIVWICRTIKQNIPRLSRIKNFQEGSGYLMLALFLTFLLFPFGTGPEGSGVKINLFFFQPGEIAKYLIVIFLAAFFFNNAKKIQTFSGKIDKDAFKIQRRTIVTTILCLGVLLVMYLKLGDMGPALVITVTFIIIYSIVRGDLWQLIIGVISFAGFLLAAKWLVPNSQWVMFVLTLVWFALWVGLSIFRKKQFFESAIFFNFVIAMFIFGGTIMQFLGFGSTAERLDERNAIYADVWNNEVRGGEHVAQSLWGLASGGVFGQGLGEGNPNLVPESHTDMVFSSIGEEMGWISLLLVTLCLAILLHRSLLLGHRNGHPFAFYLAAGIAIITGVQFLIITFGSVGLIPLTGVVVPFLSYGKVSMIMNLIAFAIVFSISNDKGTQDQKKQLKIYDSTIETCKYGYAAFAILLLVTLLKYQYWERDYTLIRPASMSDTQGARTVEYNPRIRLLMKKLDAGNIYDRNGILLATNNKEEIKSRLKDYVEAGVVENIYTNELNKRKQRYYPFGENLFFWLGDFNNTNILWKENINDPRGYIAERRHLADLRGFDNLKYEDKEKTKIKYIYLNAKKYKGTPFSEAIHKDSTKFTDYNYEFLTDFLKDGINGRKVRKHNEKRKEERDISLTVDAKLQTKMQNEIAAYAEENFKGDRWNKLRVSVVILDAANGDLLCSANYPLPNMETLKEKQNEHIYNEKDPKEKAYTDRDLGLTYQTAPGSTAKVMSALAGLQKLGRVAAKKTYYIDARETVEPPANEPNYQRDKHETTMEEAIRLSSNNYFINLVNDQDLYVNLDSIYKAAGIRINKLASRIMNGKSINYNKVLTPYFFKPDFDDKEYKEYKDEILSVGRDNIRTYRDYMDKRKKSGIYEKMSGYHNGHDWNKLAWAWGQNDMGASPLNIARVAAIVANGGTLAETQFVYKGNQFMKKGKSEPKRLVSTDEANILKGYMQNESKKWRENRNIKASFPENMGGKTGTPERGMYYFASTNVLNKKTGKPILKKINYDVDSKKDGKMNDGWYIFFIDSPKEKAPLAVAIRMERLGSGVSTNAVQLANKVVISKVLRELGYVN